MRISTASAAAAAAIGVGAIAFWYIKNKTNASSGSESAATSECCGCVDAEAKSAPMAAPVDVPCRDRTLVVLKPEALQRKLVGRVIQKLEARGFKLVSLKVTVPSAELVVRACPFECVPKAVLRHLYSNIVQAAHCSTASDKPCRFAGPVVAMVWEGKSGIAKLLNAFLQL